MSDSSGRVGMSQFMVFNTSWFGGEYIFPGWTLSNSYVYAGTLVAVFIFACTFEAFNCYVIDCHDQFIVGNTSANHYYSLKNKNQHAQVELLHNTGCAVLTSGQRLYRSVLHSVKYFFSFILMVTFMTLDVGLTLVLLVGLAVGFGLFHTERQLNNHLHQVNLHTLHLSHQHTVQSNVLQRWNYIRNKYCYLLYYNPKSLPSWTCGELLSLLLWISVNLAVAIPQFINLSTPNSCSIDDAAAGNCTLWNEVMICQDNLGLLTAANALLLMLPATRNSILLPLLGISHEKAIMYHKVLGSVFMLIATVHFGVAMYWYTLMDSFYYIWFLVAPVPASMAPNSEVAVYNAISMDHTLAGFIAYVCVLIATITSLPPIRRRFYQFFHYTHILMYLLFVTFVCIHMPLFTPWFVVPVSVLWAIDWLIRFRSTLTPTIVTSLKHINSNIIELKFNKSNFRYTASQYVYISISELGVWDSHPFTIASTTNESDISLYIHINGKWTRKLSKLVEKYETNQIQVPTIYVEGPYGSCHGFHQICRHMNQTNEAGFRRSVVLIAGGSGITLIRSVFYSLLQQVKNNNESSRIHLIWVTRYSDSLVLLNQMDEYTPSYVKETSSDDEMTMNPSHEDQDACHVYMNTCRPEIELSIYLTGLQGDSVDINQFQRSFKHVSCRVNFGRPIWNEIFQTQCVNDDIIQICGPNSIKHELYCTLNKHNDKCQIYTENYDL